MMSFREGKQEDKEDKDINKKIAELPITDVPRFYFLSIKYYIQGDDWDFAREYAMSLIRGFKKS